MQYLSRIFNKSYATDTDPITGDELPTMYNGRIVLQTVTGETFVATDVGVTNMWTLINLPKLTTFGDLSDVTLSAISSGNSPIWDGSKWVNQVTTVTKFEAANETVQLALTVKAGDMCIRTDLGATYTALNSTNATMADWQILNNREAITTVVTNTHNAVCGNIIKIDPTTIGSNCTITLPSSPSDRCKVTILNLDDVRTNTLLIARGDVLHKIIGKLEDTTMNCLCEKMLVFESTTNNWIQG